MERKSIFLIFGFVCFWVLISVVPGSAAIYKYTDQDGMLNFADDLQNIPPRYRASAIIVGGDTETNGPSVSLREQTPPKSPEAPEPIPTAPPVPLPTMKQPEEAHAAPLSFGTRMLISIIVVVSALFAFTILKILDKEHKKSIAVARMVILWGMTVFLLVAHTGDVIGLFKKADEELTAAEQKSAEKGKKAVEAMKAMNQMAEQAGLAVERAADSEKKE